MWQGVQHSFFSLIKLCFPYPDCLNVRSSTSAASSVFIENFGKLVSHRL